MRVQLRDNITLTHDGAGNVIITRPNILGKMATHTIKSTYSIWAIGAYLNDRLNNQPLPLIQNVFPAMSKEDREFLMTGITPEQWAEIFPEGECE